MGKSNQLGLVTRQVSDNPEQPITRCFYTVELVSGKTHLLHGG